jgi:hypothetical protein
LKIKNSILSERSYDENVLDDEQTLFRKIYNNNNSVQVFEYLPSLDGLSYRKLDQLNSNMNIRSLTLNLTHFHDIFTIIERTPNLIYLNIQSRLPFVGFEEYKSTNINRIRLEKFYLKSKLEFMFSPDDHGTMDINQLFRFIHLFSSSLITLSLDFTDMYLIHHQEVLYDGVELENKLLKPLTKLKNFYFYIKLHGCGNVEQMLSTFETFPWLIGVHQTAYLYSLPYSFHKLKRFRDFQDVQLNNGEILKADHRLWCKVRSLELISSDRIDFNSLFPLIKVNMPKLSSITFCGKNGYHPSIVVMLMNHMMKSNVLMYNSIVLQLFAYKAC